MRVLVLLLGEEDRNVDNRDDLVARVEDRDGAGEAYGELRNSSERRWRQARRETRERRRRFESRAADMAATDAMQTRAALDERRRMLRQANALIRIRAPSPVTARRQQEWKQQRRQRQEAIESEQRREQA